MPRANPVINPVPEPMDAIEELLLVQVPPGIKSVSVVDVPKQRLVLPLMGEGRATTCIRAVCRQPVGRVYVMITVPTDTPANKPDEIPILAIAGLAFDQLPPGRALESVVDWPKHT